MTREHATRLLDVDLVGDPQQALPYFLPALEILGRGAITDQAYERIRGAFEATDEEAER
ncbi:MAG: hypothetical protein WD010_06605 [Nitriliruptor sp.]